MRILIATGIYPPDIGGPAQYARNLYETWKKAGHDVRVAAYRWERAAPPVLRHALFLAKVWRKGWNADLVLVLDTWSAAVPAMLACRLAGKRYIIRTGGDFLYESHVERTGEKALFKDFYETKRPLFSMKERVVFRATRAVLKGAAAVIFSTEWQKDIFEKVYGLDRKKSFIVENFCGERLPPLPAGGMPENRAFVAGTRVLKWKNIDALRESFADARVAIARRGLPDIELDTSKAVYEGFVEKVRCSYAVILASLGDISPNMIFDAIRAGTPFILTKETGIAGRVAGCALFVDPLSNRDIAEKIVWLSDPANRAAQAAKVRAFGWVHSWEDIGREIIDIWKKAGKPKRIGKGGSDNSHA